MPRRTTTTGENPSCAYAVCPTMPAKMTWSHFSLVCRQVVGWDEKRRITRQGHFSLDLSLSSVFSKQEKCYISCLLLGLTHLVGLQVAQNGVHISSSKPAGEAFVAFTTMDNALRALDFNRKNMGHRYGKQWAETLVPSVLIIPQSINLFRFLLL